MLDGSFPFDLLTPPLLPTPLNSNPTTTTGSLPDFISIDTINQPDLTGSIQGLGLFEPRVFLTPSMMMASTMGVGILRSYPALMQDRSTFPPFIHPYCYGSETDGWALPKALEHAMSVSKSFADHSPDVGSKVQQAQQRIMDESPDLGLKDLLASCQAMMVYVLMRVSSPFEAQIDAELHRALFQICSQITIMVDDQSQMDQYSSWQKWIIVESKRRVNSVLRLTSQLYNLDNGLACPCANTSTATPLPASKSLWNASSEEQWNQILEKDLFYQKLSKEDLMNFRGATENNYPSKEEWARWYAGTDELGILVVITTTLL